MTDFPDWHTPQANATAISTTGVPLLSNPNVLINEQLQVIAAGSDAVYGPVTVTQTGYSLQVITLFPVAATNPFVEVVLTWTDPASGIVYDESHQFVPGSSGASGFTVLASGPARSSNLTVTVNNLDGAQAATISLLAGQHSTVAVRDTWRWRNADDNGLTVEGETLASLPDDELCLGYLHSATVNAATTLSWLFGMAPGRTVQLSGITSGVAASNVVLQAQAAPTSAYTVAGICLYEALTTPGFDFTFQAPRGPVLLKISNNATSGTLSFSGAMFAQD